MSWPDRTRDLRPRLGLVRPVDCTQGCSQPQTCCGGMLILMIFECALHQMLYFSNCNTGNYMRSRPHDPPAPEETPYCSQCCTPHPGPIGCIPLHACPTYLQPRIPFCNTYLWLLCASVHTCAPYVGVTEQYTGPSSSKHSAKPRPRGLIWVVPEYSPGANTRASPSLLYNVHKKLPGADKRSWY